MDALEAEGADVRRGQLDGQGDAGEMLADRGEQRCVVGGEGGADVGSAGDEQVSTGAEHRQRCHGDDPLARQP
ncbi:MAG: hypothetical protein QM733_19475 [Ilumatobacteraceae bacterium]